MTCEESGTVDCKRDNSHPLNKLSPPVVIAMQLQPEEGRERERREEEETSSHAIGKSQPKKPKHTVKSLQR